MKKCYLILYLSLCVFHVFSQNINKGKFIKKNTKDFFENEVIAEPDKDSLNDTKYEFVLDQTGLKLPNKIELYKKTWANIPVSQGNTSTCWAFSEVSLFESDIYRIQKKKVKLSEMYFVYWEYVEKAIYFVKEKGHSRFEEGSQINALTRIANKYGIVPLSEFVGLEYGKKNYNHESLVKELKSYFETVKLNNNWNEDTVVSNVKSILKHYIGVPPSTFKVDGRDFTPLTYMKNYLLFNPDDYINLVSYKQKPFWTKTEYEVPDNWWHSKEYYNLPINDFIKIIKSAIRNGYTLAFAGDISEIGLLTDSQVAIVPDFDVSSVSINDDARQFRFSNETTTDDHGMHLIGYLENFNGDGKDWFLVKDSYNISRYNEKNSSNYGYLFFSEDYIKLKIMNINLHKDAVKNILEKFK